MEFEGNVFWEEFKGDTMTIKRDFKGLVVGDTLTFIPLVRSRGQILDLSLATSMLMTVKENPDDPETAAVVQITGTYPLGENGSQGRAEFKISSNESINFDSDKTYYYDIQFKFAGDLVYTSNYGTLEFIPEITRT